MATTTFNPSDKNASITLSGGDLIVASTGGGFQSVRGTTSKTAGLWYFEITHNSGTQHMVGLGNSTQALNTFPGATGNNSVGYYSSAGERFINGASAAYGAGFAPGDVVGVLYDADGDTVVFSKNGTAYASIDISAISGAIFPMWSSNTAAGATANFGATAFSHQPGGSDAWNNDAGGGGLSIPVVMNQYRQRRS